MTYKPTYYQCICLQDHTHICDDNTYNYTRRQIKNDQPGSHDFRRFLRQFWTDFLEILHRPFSIIPNRGKKIRKIIFNISKVRPFAM